jgi:hypothetical protein
MAKSLPVDVPDSIPTELLGERCDRCGGIASFRVELRTGILFFCTDHHERYGEALARSVAIPRSL